MPHFQKVLFYTLPRYNSPLFFCTIPPHSTPNPGKNLTKETCRPRDRFIALCFPARPEQTEINAPPSFYPPPLCLFFLFLLVCALCLKQAQFSYIPIAMKCPAASVSCKNTGSFSWGSSASSVQNAQIVCVWGGAVCRIRMRLL